jgi:hypothetical protein
MLNKFTVLALIGATQSAVSPLPNTTFPKYATVVTPLTSTSPATLGSVAQVLVAYVTSNSVVVGPHRAYRNNVTIFPTQTVVKAD